MKKRFLLSAILMSLSLLSSCGKSEEEAINLTFGKLYDWSLPEKVEEHLVNITHSELSSLIKDKKEFILFVYDKDNTCTCYEDFEKVAILLLQKKNALIYGIAPTEFDGGHETFGLNIAKSEETVAIFKDGKLKHQKTTSGANDPFLEESAFLDWFYEKAHFSKMLYVEYNQLLDLFEKGEQFTVGFLRSSCSDCAYVEDTVLSSFNAKDSYSRNSYVIECDTEGIRLSNGVYDELSWAGFKDRFGLTSSSNEDYGYGQGFVPSFYTYSGATSLEERLRIVDAAVYLNDTIKEDSADGSYYVADSFYTEERKPLLNFLGNTKIDTEIIKGIKIPKQDVENGMWKKSAAAKYHDPLLLGFLEAYAGKGFDYH